MLIYYVVILRSFMPRLRSGDAHLSHFPYSGVIRPLQCLVAYSVYHDCDGQRQVQRCPGVCFPMIKPLLKL